MNSDDKYIDLLEFLPQNILCGKLEKQFPLNIKLDSKYLSLSYITDLSNQTGQVGTKEYSLTIPRFISKIIRTFEVLGLLQAEMGKTNNGNLSFANHEYKLINYVLYWFEKELEFDIRNWKWSIKLNIQEPTDLNYKHQIENKVIKYWTERTKITLEQSYPKKVTYISNTKNIKLKDHDYGTLVLEHKNNLFSQIIKSFVKIITYREIVNYEAQLIQGYMGAIIAGEGCIEISKQNKKFRVHISASKEEEKEIFYQCLKKLGIESIKYKGDKLVISKRRNNVQLLKQRLMTLSPAKYTKFLYMMQQYPNISQETRYFKEKGQNVWNKIPQEKLNKIIKLYNSGITNTKELSQKLNLHILKVQRVLKENNLGKRTIKTSESKRLEIFNYIIEHPTIPQKDIAILFKVHPAVVSRAWLKYKNKIYTN